MQRGTPDPYRELGVPRAATEEQIKAAHRKLAKRYHPDAAGGDTPRFLAVQEAYSLLSDPLRRHEWDTRHAPGPVRAGDAMRRGQRPRASDGRWTREEGTPGGARPRQPGGAGGRRPAPARPATGGGAGGTAGSAGSAGPAGSGGAAGRGAPGPTGAADPRAAHDRRENRADADWNASGRDPSTRSYRWSAENVPWWEDFSPRGSAERAAAADPKAAGRRSPAGNRAGTPKQTPGGAGAGATGAGGIGSAAGGGSRGSAAAPGGARHQDEGVKPDHGDVYSRSSGAAWSSAARRYFRKADTDLASRGAFVYRGTQVVTGAKAREASEELLRQRPNVGSSPRQAFDPRPSDGPPRGQEGGAARHPSDHGATFGRAEAQPPASAPAGEGSPPFYADPDSDAFEGDAGAGTRRSPSLLGAASVGAVASFAVTLPMLVLGSFVLDPPLQPMFAVLLLLIAALTGAVAAAAWVRLRPAG